MRVRYEDLRAEFLRVLLAVGFKESKADEAAGIFADASRDGVVSHGLNRFPVFIDAVKRGFVRPHAEAEVVLEAGALERWQGNLGPGMLNARAAMARAIELADTNGIGCVALAGTNHWMRGGTYGWQAAEAGKIGICWSNTKPNMPPWGSEEPRLGNNPLVVSVPEETGNHVVLDMAMTQFSLGQLETYRLQGAELPVFGGYDSEGRLTLNPGEVERSGRTLPIGFWKGSGLSLVLDLVAVLLSGGKAVQQVSDEESGLSQVFIAIAPPGDAGSSDAVLSVSEIVSWVQGVTSAKQDARYPGERALLARRESLKSGVEVNADRWQQLLAMTG